MNAIEKMIARRVVTGLLAAGLRLTVDYDRGYDPTNVVGTGLTDIPAIIAAMDEVDECWLMIGPEGAEAFDGFVYMIWGNGEEGRTCISNYSSTYSPIIDPIGEWADTVDPYEDAMRLLDAAGDALGYLNLLAMRYGDDAPERMKEFAPIRSKLSLAVSLAEGRVIGGSIPDMRLARFELAADLKGFEERELSELLDQFEKTPTVPGSPQDEERNARIELIRDEFRARAAA